MLWRLRAALITDPLIVLTTAVFSTICVVASLFDSSGRAPRRVERAWAQALLAISGVKVGVQGLEKIVPDSSYVVVANHLSYMDIPVLLACLPVQPRFLAKESLFRLPFLGWAMPVSYTHLTLPTNREV